MIDWQAFHFIRPEWLFAIIPLLVIVILLTRISVKQSGWQGIVSSHLYQHLVVTKDKKSYKPPFFLLALVWVIASVAMAGPTWEKLPQPVYQVSTGKVVVLDMSMSMRATDIQPDRLTRAKFKAIDLLNSLEDGEVGLVVYAGDAFTVSPLTSDVSNITALIPSLRPEIMPVPGSNPLAAIVEAQRLLSAAGYNSGEVYWISDGIDVEDIPDLKAQIEKSPYRFSILGVGTQKGAPIKMLDGGFLKDGRGNIVLPALYSRYFAQILGNTNGRYTPIQSDGSDIDNMRFTSMLADQEQVSDDIIGQGDQWQDMGALLICLILPFAAYAFRRGVLVVLISACVMMPTEPIYAQTNDEDSNVITWADNAFKNANQRGVKAFNNNDFGTASSTFDDLMWKGAALFKNKEYAAALDAFTQVPGAESSYNQGNALAHLGQLEKALEKYNETLAQRPGHTNAMANKKLVEDLLEQQEQQSKDGDQQGDQDQQEDQQSGDSESGEQQDKQGSSSEQNGDSAEQQDSEQQSSEEQSSEEQASEEQNAEQQQGEQEGQQEANEQEKTEESAQNQADEGEAGEQKSNLKAQKSVDDMTPEEKEQMQRMQMLMNKVPDDPAYLLQRKMLLESQKRRNERFSQPNKKDW